MKSSTDISSVLHPSKEDLLQAEIASGDVGALQDKAVIDARKCMNAMSTVGQALLAVNQSDKGADDFQGLMNEVARVSRMLLVRWGHNPEDRKNRWMINVIEKTLIPYVSLNETISDEKVDALSEMLVERSIDFPEHNLHQNDAMIDLAIFKGLASLLDEQSKFDFMRKKNQWGDLESLKNKVVSSCVLAMNELSPSLLPAPDRVTFLTMLLNEGFFLMASAWKKNASHAHQALSSLSKEQIKTWKTANPDGFSLDPVVENFEQNMGRLLRLTLAARKNDKK